MRIPPTRDTGGIVVGWLVKLVAVFAVTGVLAFDAVSLGVAQLAVTDTAAAASRAASHELESTGNVQLAYGVAVALATEESVDNEVPSNRFAVAPDGTVTLSVVRHPPTLLVHYVPRSEDWLVLEATSSYLAD